MLKRIRAGFLTITASMVIAGSMVVSPLSAVAAPNETFMDKGVQNASEENPGGNASATVSSSSQKFKDVPKSNQFYKEIQQLAEYEVSTGWKDGTYRPLSSVNRDAMIVFLYRAMGSPEFTEPKKSPFIDVSTDNVFYKEITWAYSKGISTGWEMKNGTRQFRPLEPVKRDAMAAFLMRASGAKAPTVKSSFKDVRKNQEHAAAITWMKDKNISKGWSDNTYRPLNNTNRDAMAAFVIRWLDNAPPSATTTRKATVKEQRDWTSSLPTVCQEIEIRNFRIINPTKNGSSFNASVTYSRNYEMYYSLYIDGNLKPDSAPATALMKHECGHVLMGIYANEKGGNELSVLLDKGWKSSNDMRVENAADCISDRLGAVRETNNYTVGYGTKCSAAQNNVANIIINYSTKR